jgi:hypothetical protein
MVDGPPRASPSHSLVRTLSIAFHAGGAAPAVSGLHRARLACAAQHAGLRLDQRVGRVRLGWAIALVELVLVVVCDWYAVDIRWGMVDIWGLLLVRCVVKGRSW